LGGLAPRYYGRKVRRERNEERVARYEAKGTARWSKSQKLSWVRIVEDGSV